MFPKTVDYHKPDKRLVPNGLGVIYVLASVAYLFLNRKGGDNLLDIIRNEKKC